MKPLIYSLTLVLAALLAMPGHAEAPKPNIIFIFCDDLGYGDVGVFHQNERAAKKDRSIPFFTTPHLDSMAKGGIQFRQHYCAAPVCAPSRASLLTGTHQGHAAIRDNQFDKELPDTHTIASVLKEAGYATAAFGKWGLQGTPDKPEKRKQAHPPGEKFPGWPSMPTDRGFDHFLGYVRHRDGHYHYPVEDNKQVWENKTEVSKGMELCFTPDLFTAAAKRWIVDHHEMSPDQPFMVYLAHDTPHAILQNPPCAYPEGGGLKGGVQWLGKPGQMINTAKGTYDGWMHPDYANATWDHDKDPKTAEVEWPDVQRRYANLVRRIDDTVGDLMQLLEDLEIDDNTLVIFSSDNGPSQESYLKGKPYHPTFFHGFGPFDGIKRDTLEGGLRVPTIAKWPAKTKAGCITDKPSAHYDWLATFADAAGLPVPAASDGVSLMPTLSPKTHPQNASAASGQQPSLIYSEYSVGGKTPNYEPFHPSHRGKVRGQMQVVLLNPNLKGLRTGIKTGDEDFEIYDLKSDPKEVHNLAGKDDTVVNTKLAQEWMKDWSLQLRKPLDSAPRPYDGALIPAIGKHLYMVGQGMEWQPTRSGATYSSESGAFPWMPKMNHFSPYSHHLHGFTLPEGLKAPFAIRIDAAIEIPADGTYTFKVDHNSHSMLFVHHIRLIDEISKATQGTQSASLPLKSGWHPVSLYFRTQNADPSLSLQIIGPNGKALDLKGEKLRVIR